MVPASGESSDTKSFDPAVASSESILFLCQSVCTGIPAPPQAVGIWICGPHRNSGNLGSTFAFGSGAPEAIFFDNYIIGGAYQRDFIQFNSGVLIGAEVGLADRFGDYFSFVVTGLSIQIASRIQRSYGVGFPFDTKASPCSMQFEFHLVLCLG